MGLDMVELVLECEDQFGISIDDDAASQVASVGDLYQVILRQIPEGNSASGGAFYQLRRGLIACGIDRDRILPTSRLDDLLPRQQRRVLWDQLSAATRLRLPKLQPRRIVANVTALGVLLSLLIGFGLAVMNKQAGLLLIGLGGACLAGLIHPLARSLQDEFPPHCQTIEDLVYAVIGQNAGRFSNEGGLTEREAWRVLQRIVAEQLRVPEEKVTPEARFVEDLHVG